MALRTVDPASPGRRISILIVWSRARRIAWMQVANELSGIVDVLGAAVIDNGDGGRDTLQFVAQAEGMANPPDTTNGS